MRSSQPIDDSLVRVRLLPFQENDTIRSELQTHLCTDLFKDSDSPRFRLLVEPLRRCRTRRSLQSHDVRHGNGADELDAVACDPNLVPGLELVEGRDDPRLKTSIEVTFWLVV